MLRVTQVMLSSYLQDKRKAVLDKFYTTFDRPGLNEVIADDFTLRERSSTASQTFSKAGRHLASAGTITLHA